MHVRLDSIVKNFVPMKSSLSYFKPYTIDVNDKVKFSDGEIDFIYLRGEQIVPVEVKSSQHINSINTSLLEKFIHERKLPFAVVIYNGVPFLNRGKKILYWPLWLI